MAIREDEDVARTMGVRATSTKAIAFMISASLTGLLGASYTYHAHIIEPFSAFSLDLSAAPILMAILGGTRTWVGPLVGATLYQAISTALAVSFGNEYTNLMFSAFLIIVVLLLPNGIVGLAKRKTKLDAASDPGVKMQLKPSELDR
jgi:branched-chain amino acid transport system permease protein